MANEDCQLFPQSAWNPRLQAVVKLLTPTAPPAALMDQFPVCGVAASAQSVAPDAQRRTTGSDLYSKLHCCRPGIAA